MRDRRRLALVLAVIGVLAVLLCAGLRNSFPGHSREPEPVRTHGPIVAPLGFPAPGPGAGFQPAGEQHRSATIQPNGLDDTAASQTPEQRFLSRMNETRAELLKKYRYPDESQPLAMKTDLLMPHHVEPTMRGLGGSVTRGPDGKPRGGKVQIVQNQDRVYLMPGQSAVATFSAMGGDRPVAINLTRSELVREAQTQGAAPTVVGRVEFHDDGAPPDEMAGDGTWSGTVTPPSDGVAAGLLLYVDLEAEGEKGTLAYTFIQTASPPGKFTGTARSAIENGSVAFYVGIEVTQPGPFEIVGRVYDSTGTPIVYARFYDQLTADSHEVRLLAFGKLLLDEGAVPPLVLRDVEGHRMVLGKYPDREMMQDWPCGYQTPSFSTSQLSDADYNSPVKQEQLNALDHATQDGLADIRSQPQPPSVPEPAVSH